MNDFNIALIARPDNGVVVYPEGHRFKETGSLPLKTGVMEVAYNLKVPCQCVVANGKVWGDVVFIFSTILSSFTYF